MNNSSYSERINIAFHLFGYPIHWYSITMFIAIIATVTACMIQAKKRKLPIKPLETFSILAVIVGFIGARLWYLAGSPVEHIHSFIDIIAVWRGGIAIEGAVVFDSILALIYFPMVARKYKINAWIYIDIIMINLLLGQAIGRWGNFFNQEILGPQTNKNSFPIILLPNFIVNHLHLVSENAKNGFIIKQPLFLYESILSMFAWFALIFWFPNKKKKLKTGTSAFIWFMWYGIVRSIMEPFRDQSDILVINHIPVSIIISIIFVILSIIFILINENIIRWKFWNYKIRKIYDKRE